MISMNNIGSAGKALNYFSADNYYTQEEGLDKSEWFGAGARILDLKGKIDKDDFSEILEGKIGAQQLGKLATNPETDEPYRDHRPGTDITFSAPKSVSLLAEVAENHLVRQAHEHAVKVALQYIESNLAQTRQVIDGQLKRVHTNNLIVALFRHSTSRDLDPQTHTHAAMMNATQREDGKWGSTFNDDVFKAQRVIGAIYTGELATGLQKLGFELIRTDERGNFEIAGMSRGQLEEFSQRRAEIKAALEERGIDISTASAQSKENAALFTRVAKVDVEHAALRDEWQVRAHHAGIDFASIQSKAEKIREQGGIKRLDKLSGRQAMAFAAAHLIEREAVVTKQMLLRTALEHSVGRTSPRSVIHAFDTLVNEGHLIHLAENQYTTAKMLSCEKWSLEQILEHKGKSPQIMALETVSQQLAAAEQLQGFRFTEGQKNAISQVLSTEDRFVAIQGLAGTGKSTMLKTLGELAKNEGYIVRGMAPTGAASKIMTRETGVAADTVSMFLIKEREFSKHIAMHKEHRPEFERGRELWVVDESSFLSQRQKAQLDHMAVQADARIAFLGDALQLQSVEAGKPFELAQKGGIETAYMTEIGRQKTPELKRVVDIIVGRDHLKNEERLNAVELKQNERAFQLMDQAGMVHEIKNIGLLNTLVSDIASMSGAERDRTLVITAFNQDRHLINSGVRLELQKKGEISGKEMTVEIFLSKGWTRAEIKEAQYYRPGDVIRFGRDYRKVDAAKGEYMRVASVDAPHGLVLLHKQDGTAMSWEPNKFNTIEVYKSETRAIAVGDLIRMTRSEGQLKNGETGRVVALDATIAVLEVKQGNRVSQHEVNLSVSRHWDYAYASTVHAAQGATRYRTLFHIRTPDHNSEHEQSNELKTMAKVFGDRSFYVGSTRATHDMKIYTNNKQTALEIVTAKQDKTSAIEILGVEKQIGRGLGR